MKIALLGTLAVLVFSLPLLAFANGPELVSGSYTINSAGATFPYPLIDLWRVEIAKETSENLQLNYQSIGSGGGVQQHIAKTVNFAATDAPLKISKESPLILSFIIVMPVHARKTVCMPASAKSLTYSSTETRLTKV